MSNDVDYPPGCQPIKPTANHNELIKRLRTLADALHDCPPNKDISEPLRFLSLFRHLSDAAFLDNSNPDVQIYLAICLSSILRLYSPEIPASDVLQLKEVYLFLFRVLKHLGEVRIDNPIFKRYHYLVEVIAVILQPLTEMKDMDDKEAIPVFRALIKSILTIPCGKGWNKALNNTNDKVFDEKEENKEEGSPEDDGDEEGTIISKVTSILINIASSAIQELDYVPNEILDVLFFHFIEPQRSHYPDAYCLAQDIARKTKSQLEPSIHNMIHLSTMIGELPEEFELCGSKNRQKFYEVFRVLNHIGNDLVAPAIPYLVRWLQVECEQTRIQTVRLIGQMCQEKNCQFGYSSSDLTWKGFLNCAIDESVEVRKQFVKQSKHVLISNNSHLRGQVTNCLVRLSKDLDDDVRELVIVIVTEIAQTKLEAISDTLLKACCVRMKDKKIKVKLTAIKHMMFLYNHVMTSTPNKSKNIEDYVPKEGNEEEYTDSEKGIVEFIPTYILHIYRTTHSTPGYEEARAMIERYFQLYFVPYKLEPKRRVELMAHLFRKLDPIATAAFGDIVSRSSQIRRALIGICNDISSVRDTKFEQASLKDKIRRLSSIFIDSSLLEKILLSFVNQVAEDETTFELMKYLISDDYTTTELVSKASELVRRTQERKTVAGTNPTQQVFRRFIDRCTPLVMDSESAKCLTDLVSSTVIGLEQKKKSSEETFLKDLELFKIWTEHFAHLFTNVENVEKIRKEILGADDAKAVEAAVYALSSIFSNTSFRAKMRSEEFVKAKWFVTLKRDLKDLMTRTEHSYYRCVKLSIRLTTWITGNEEAVKIYDEIVDDFITNAVIENPGCANAFHALSEIFAASPSHYLDKMINLIDCGKIGTEILLSDKASEDDPIDFDSSLVFEKQVLPKYTLAKIAAAKFATKILDRGQNVLPDKQRLIDSAILLINQFENIILNKGETDSSQCELEKAALRATVGSCLLKLANCIGFRSKISSELLKNMSDLINDEALCVRTHYVSRLKKNIGRRLPIDFAGCFGIVNIGSPFDDENPNTSEQCQFNIYCQNSAITVFKARSEDVAIRRQITGSARVMFCAETVVAYTCWLLANSPFFQTREDVEILSEIRECLWVVINALRAANCNMQKVFKVFERLKEFGDLPKMEKLSMKSEELKEHNEKLWAVSDLGITMMLYRAKINIYDRPDDEKPSLNRQLFYKCSDADPSQVFIPDEMIDDEKQRNGKLPKRKKGGVSGATIQNVSRNTSKRGRNTTRNAGGKRGGKTNAGRKKKAANVSNTIYEDDDDDEELHIDDDDSDLESTSTSTRGKRPSSSGGKNDVFEIPEEEDDEPVEAPSFRSRLKRSADPSKIVSSTKGGRKQESNGKKDDVYEIPEGEEDNEPVEPPSLKRRGRSAMKDNKTDSIQNGDSPSSPAKKRGKRSGDSDLSQPSESSKFASPKKGARKQASKKLEDLENLMISPIVNDNRRSRRTASKSAAFVSSTPLRVEEPAASISKRKKAEESNNVEEEVSTRRVSAKRKKSEKFETPKKSERSRKAKGAENSEDGNEEDEQPVVKRLTRSSKSKAVA